jgi:hypothetical protein
MGDIYDLMVNEARQSFYQLENVTAALDSKAFGIVAFDTILLSVFAYIISLHSSRLFYIAPIFLIVSLLCVLICVKPRKCDRQCSDLILKTYGKLSYEQAATNIAANYAGLEEDLYKIYEGKFKYLNFGLILLFIALLIEGSAFIYFGLDP